VLCWDNSYSLLRSKTIAYRTWLVKPASPPPTEIELLTTDAPAAAAGEHAPPANTSHAPPCPAKPVCVGVWVCGCAVSDERKDVKG
jgi:hypothetical protein